MKIEQMNLFSDENFDESTGIRNVVERYVKHLRWFVLSVIFFIVIAFFYIRFSVPTYQIDSSILIKEISKESSFDKLSSIEEFGLFGVGSNSLENEIQLLKSRRLITKVVKELKLNIKYYIINSPYNIEKYPNYPIILDILDDSSEINKINSEFEIYIKGKGKFDFIQFDGEVISNLEFEKDFKVNLGNEDISNTKLINIKFNDNFKEEIIGQKIKVVIRPLNTVVDLFLKKLEIKSVNENLSDVITLSINETIIEKGEALINNLVDQFNADGISDKALIAQTTTDFLDERLELISAELTGIEATAAQFKTSKGMINAETEANYYMQSSTVAESDMVSANTQLEIVKYMLDELNNSDATSPLPGNIGLSNIGIVNMISDYNNLILQRNRILKSSSDINPIIVNIDSQLKVLKNNLISSLNNIKSSSEIQINALNKRSGRISSKIASAPIFEKEYKDIVREQETKNALYLFLLQKREESILSNAVEVNKAKVIDAAYSSRIPVSPKAGLIYFTSILFGLIIPFVIIYLNNLLDTKVHDEDDIKQLKLPYLGDVPQTSSQNDLFISDIDNSNIAESFRYLRTNINFMLDRKEKGKTVFVTSTQSQEGKTFTAINLAYSLAISGKKTLLIGLDLRAPKISNYVNGEEEKGVTNFIKNSSLTVEDITKKHPDFDNLNMIHSGTIPPNPVELLMSKRVKEIFDKVKCDYEYIIVDTAPVGMVTDTIQVSQFADLTIYVIKANHLDKRMLHIPEKLNRENKLPNMAILINGSDHSKGAYGYGYGYGYGKKKKIPWFKKVFKNVAF